ncbi:MAG: HAMP domain-containing protein [Gammaproteobacteria bacterium]|nr:MAG: HAMP domain-containing protein [Gammaproteobacteria bacterium]
MGRLFWKIFLWFWLATLLMGAAVAWGVAQYYRHSDDVRLSAVRRELLQARLEMVAEVLERGGARHARRVLERMPQRRLHLFVVDEQGRELLGRPLPPGLREVLREHVEEEPESSGGEEDHEHWPARAVTGADGVRYRLVAAFPPPPPMHALLQRGDASLTALRLGIAAGVSALLCFWLAWYLSRPVRSLRQAARELAAGHLDSRVGDLGGRRDEIADLATDFDHMAQRLQAQVENQRRLLRDLSHELRSPLARLQVALGLARRQGPEELGPQLDRIERDLGRMEQLIGQMLALSRTEAQAAGEPAAALDLMGLLQEVIRDVAIEAAEKGCVVDLAAPPSWPMRGHPELLRRALENLLRNAVRHTAPGSRIEVRAEPRGGAIHLEFRDAGPGVPEEQLERIFEPFVRLDEAREHAGGHGLGLAIARAAVQAHGGTLRARNREGGGLCVELELPAAGSAQPARAASPQKGL